MSTNFNFFQHWYPLIPIEDIDPKRPTAVTLLGMPLVIWRSPASSEYGVFLDQCPHRLAPLSEGHIYEKTGNLMCAYHGWQFDQTGICTHVPQAENPELIAKNQADFCLKAFPCKQVNQLLWVWADRQTPELAENTPLPLSPMIDANQGFVWTNYVRDLAYDWQTLIENLVDPSHVPFAHHGIQGNRERATPIPMEIDVSTADLIIAKINRNLPTKITFQPPCLIEYEINLGKDGKKFGLVVYCLPNTPGKSRIVSQFPRNFSQKMQKLQPRWWEHIKERNAIIDGDMLILHYQENCYQQKQQAAETWKTAYKMPTSADRLVIEFRKWFDQYCQGKLPWSEVGITPPAINPIEPQRQIIFDRYHQHTQHCASCRQALRNMRWGQIALLVYAVISIATVAVMSEYWRGAVGLPLILTSLAGLGLCSWLQWKIIPQFYFVDYIHADR